MLSTSLLLGSDSTWVCVCSVKSAEGKRPPRTLWAPNWLTLTTIAPLYHTQDFHAVSPSSASFVTTAGQPFVLVRRTETHGYQHWFPDLKRYQSAHDINFKLNLLGFWIFCRASLWDGPTRPVQVYWRLTFMYKVAGTTSATHAIASSIRNEKARAELEATAT